MHTTLKTDLLASMLKEKRGSKGLRAVADEIGDISASTLSRIEQGRVPDVDTFVRLCGWLEMSTEIFITENIEMEDNRSLLIGHLRADKTLKQDTIDMLVQVINHAYTNIDTAK